MIYAIFAVDETSGMGFQGSMPWPRNKQDLMWFKSKTQNQTVVMGKRTWESSDMPIPLPNRINVLITNEFVDREDIIQIHGDVCDALLHLQNYHKHEHIFVIGGPNILMQAAPVIDCVYLTRIPGEYVNDTFIDLAEFLKEFELRESFNMETCIIEEYKRCNSI